MKLGNTALTDIGIDVDGATVRLSPQRRRILERLMKAQGKCIDAGTLMDVIWDGRDDGPETRNVVRVHIHYLRRDLRAAGSQVQVVAHYGYGYAATA